MNIPIRSTTRSARRIASVVVALCIGVLSGITSAQTVTDISNSPLYGGLQPHPNVVVSTSVEFPTVGAAYLNIQYVRTRTYSGYFDSARCYQYTSTSGGYFSTSAGAVADANHECSNAFSGNFMNWLTMSAIDEFRYAMTGGNRVDETRYSPNNGTLIERAYLPDGTLSGVPDFYALDSNFPRIFISNGSTGSMIGGAPNGATTSSGTFASKVLPFTSFDSSTIYITNCRAQMYVSTVAGGNCGSPSTTSGGTYNVRVNVCDTAEGPVRTDLCLQYGGTTGKYKPVGQVQINAARMRFAAFGYLMDRSFPGYSVPPGCDESGWNQCRYGGVLRAPMKYVGATNYDANQLASANGAKEINADGTLVNDPERTASAVGGQYSGFINYINKFGSNGVYKRTDPGGEMFYEAIRYFQKLGPTPEATSGTINNTILDFFPITTAWTDPIGSICSSNYVINLSDANTWNDSYLPGYNGTPSPGTGRPSSRPVEGGLDAYLWTSRIGQLESTMTSITPGDVVPSLVDVASAARSNRGTNLSAGAAFWANVNDIRSDLDGKQTVKTISFDVGEAVSANNDVRVRQLYLMGKYGGFDNTIDRASDTFANPFWGINPADPRGAAIRTNSEWESALGSAYPADYLLASDPQKLIDGLRAAFARINSETGTLSGAALTSANLTYGSAGAYIATFDPGKWSGTVLFNSLSVDAVTGNLVVSSIPIWDAGALLSARCGTIVSASTVCTDTDTSVNQRKIFTTVKSSGTRTAVPFTYAAISARDPNYLAALNTSPATNVGDGNAQQRINYLRGYRADEASALGFRGRDSAMGDIINSGPVYVGPPTASIPDNDYQSFYSANTGRTPAVYVGANDGMLHAFRASDGVELFSYIPGYSSDDLNDLTNPGYQHEVFVDTVPKVQEAKIGSTWKTVLVGASGSGAQGIFALDVTNPGAFDATKVMFEFSDADDPDFGSVMSAPEFAKLWVSGPASAPVYRYFAVVTGYNNRRTTVNYRADTQVSADTLNKGVLFLIALDHTLGTAWTLNSDYYKFTFPASNTARPNGLAPVTLLASATGDRSTAAMYFGDLQGQLWKFNTATGNPSTWGPARGTRSAPQPIFLARDASNNAQPITARVELANGPFGSTMVFFGTGKYLGLTDLTLPAASQSEYGLLDVNPSVLISRTTDLVPRTGTISGATVTVTGAAFSYSGTSAKKGWYLDFPGSVSIGERSVTKPAVSTGLLTFTTLTLSSNLCASGNGYIYQVNALTGLAVGGAGATIGYASTVGIPGPPRVVDLTLTTGLTQAAGEQINLKTQTTLVAGTLGKIGSFGPQIPVKAPPTQQINWREITNWNERTGH